MVQIVKIKRVYTRPEAWIVAILIAALAAGWPLPQSPRMYPDSAGYIGMSSERMPVYSLLASLLRPTYALVCVQFVLSLAAWSWLGYTIGRVVGVLLGACFALSLPIYVWSLVVLSESLSLSLLAVLLAATVHMYRGGESATFAAWTVSAVLFSMTRVINMLLLPFLVVPIAGAAGVGRKRIVAAVTVVAIVVGAGVVYNRTVGASLRDTSLTNIYMRKIAPINETHQYFIERGMPIYKSMRAFYNQTGAENKNALFEAAPPFEEWLRERGAAVYIGWVFGRWASYYEPRMHMTAHASEDFASFSAGTRMRSLPRSMKWFYGILYIPYGIWIFGLLLPFLSWRISGRASPDTLFTVALMVAGYVQAFTGYHGDATETTRHMISALVLYKITSLLIVVGFVKISLCLYRRRRAIE